MLRKPIKNIINNPKELSRNNKWALEQELRRLNKLCEYVKDRIKQG